VRELIDQLRHHGVTIFLTDETPPTLVDGSSWPVIASAIGKDG
jgi:hypothetical protein